jgi:hypothetical protein
MALRAVTAVLVVRAVRAVAPVSGRTRLMAVVVDKVASVRLRVRVPRV